LLAIQAGGVVVLDTNNYLTVMTETLSIEVSKELKARLPPAAKSRQTKPSTMLREALEVRTSGVKVHGIYPPIAGTWTTSRNEPVCPCRYRPSLGAAKPDKN
jgi:hypothetical protein